MPDLDLTELERVALDTSRLRIERVAALTEFMQHAPAADQNRLRAALSTPSIDQEEEHE